MRISIFLIFLLGNLSHANNFDHNSITDDLKYLSKTDQNYFSETCLKNNKILEISDCYNFLGIKLFLSGYTNSAFSKEKLKILYYSSINYLVSASKKGSKQALKNLGWIYSNDNLDLQDLEKSATFFSRYYKSVSLKPSAKMISEEKKSLDPSPNYSDIIYAITLFRKLEIFYEISKNKKKKYLTKDELRESEKYLNNLIEKRNISKKNLIDLEKKVFDNNKIIFTFLKNDLKKINNQNMIQANELMNKLKNLINHSTN